MLWLSDLSRILIKRSKEIQDQGTGTRDLAWKDMLSHDENQTWWYGRVWAHFMLGGQERWIMGRSVDRVAPGRSNILASAKALSQE